MRTECIYRLMNAQKKSSGKKKRLEIVAFLLGRKGGLGGITGLSVFLIDSSAVL